MGTTLGHYEILEVLGSGGMGDVYRSRDTKLGRDVALKVLPPDMAADPIRLARFRREARAVAALTHPNIVTVFSVDQDALVHFLTMELVQGNPLSQVIPSGGFAVDVWLDIALPLLDAVAAAHEQGVVHRDLKPANIMVTSDQRVKVLDFGLAKLRPAAEEMGATVLETEMPMTREGVIVGTVPYMSPEQIEGRGIDHRTDIFSCGVVLYEMATGQRPFVGASSPALMASILKDTPRPLSEINDRLPQRLGKIIARCLEKDVDARYPTARDVFEELGFLQREITTAGVSPVEASSAFPLAADASGTSGTSGGSSVGGGALASGEISLTGAASLRVAVMPFVAGSGDADIASLADGLGESVVAGLSRFSYLRVVSPESSFASRNQELDPIALGEQLAARYVVQGSVRGAGSTVRVSVRLLDSVTGAHLWAENYDRRLEGTGLFAVQDEMAAQIVATSADLHGVLPRSMSAVVKAKPAETLTPYEAVLRKFDYWRLITADEHREVRDCLERAVQQDPGYADAWAALSLMYAEEHKHSFNPRPDPLGRALDAARRATAVDATSHLAFHALAQAQFFRKDFGAFRASAERAIALNPWDAVTVAFMGIMMAYSGDWDHGVEIARGAAELNPHHPGWFRFAEVMNHYRQGAWEEALAIAQQINMPSYFYAHLALAITNARAERPDAASEALAELLELSPGFSDRAAEEISKWYEHDLVVSILEGLRLAGLSSVS